MYSKALRDFQKSVFIKTGDYRHALGQIFVAGNPTARVCSNLIVEEALELSKALLTEDLHQVRKEIADVLYVVYGAAVKYDINVFSDFLVVHNNNMMKIKNGTIDINGKFTKAIDHPKVIFI